MGEILTEIRDELCNIPNQTPIPPNTSTEDKNYQPDTHHSVTTTNQAMGGVDTGNGIIAGINNGEESRHPDMEH